VVRGACCSSFVRHSSMVIRADLCVCLYILSFVVRPFVAGWSSLRRSSLSPASLRADTLVDPYRRSVVRSSFVVGHSSFVVGRSSSILAPSPGLPVSPSPVACRHPYDSGRSSALNVSSTGTSFKRSGRRCSTRRLLSQFAQTTPALTPTYSCNPSRCLQTGQTANSIVIHFLCVSRVTQDARRKTQDTRRKT
jgi:hypothetical protein